MISELINHPYQDRLSALNLPSLAYRRHRMGMIMLYKIIHSLALKPAHSIENLGMREIFISKES